MPTPDTEPATADRFWTRAWSKSPDEDRFFEVSSETLTDDAQAVLLDGHKCGEVHLGSNGRWFWVSLDRISWADPLQGMDNVAGTGWGSPEKAALTGLDLWKGEWS